MGNDIEKIIKDSAKAEFLEDISKELIDFDKAVIILVKDGNEDKYTSLVLTLGINKSYEALGLLDIAKSDLENADDIIKKEE